MADMCGKELKAEETGSEGGEVPESMEEEELEMKEDKEELPPMSPVMGEWPGSMCCSVMQVRRRVFMFCLRTRSHTSLFHYFFPSFSRSFTEGKHHGLGARYH